MSVSTSYLKRFFAPKSIAVFGASEKPNSMGGVVLSNLIDSGYRGTLIAVNKQGYEQVFNIPCYSGVGTMPEMPDLAIICSPPDAVPGIIRKLGANQVRAALILTGGLSRTQNDSLQPLKDAVVEAAKPYGIRILGPDCMGLLVPGQNMNASYSHLNINKGKVAYVGQSGILGTAMIDWAHGQGIGFSNFMTLGGSVDVDMPSVIDYLANDPYTHALLVQVDRIDTDHAHHFISAIRAAARNKLVLVLKNELDFDGQKGTRKVPLGVTDLDKVYDAVLRRVGVVRVASTDELFDALETLTMMKPLRGERLAIVGNGAGPNALAANRLLRHKGKLATLTEESTDALKGLLPDFWNRSNPIDLNADATPELFSEAVKVLTKDKNVDAVLVIHAPTRLAPGSATAEAIIKATNKIPRNVLTCWMGRSTAIAARNLFNEAKIPTFITPEKAAEAFMHMVDFRRNQEVMKQTPEAMNLHENKDGRARAKEMVDDIWRQGRNYLRHNEASRLLEFYEIPVSHSHYAHDIDGAVEVAKHLGGAVAVKALHRGNLYPFSYDEGSGQRWRDLALDLYSVSEVKHAVTQLAYRVSERYSNEDQRGFCIQQMKRGLQSVQISVGVTRDPVFGPLIFFGAGGYTVDVLDDRQLMLPPLNESLARRLIKSSRIYSFIKENSHRFDQDIKHLCELLIHISQMVVDIPQLKSMEINPLLVNKRGLLAVDTCAELGDPCSLAISPYPDDLLEVVHLKRSGRVVELRPIRGEDEPNHLEFWNSLSPESVRMRYFYSRGVPTHSELASWSQIDYDREMAFIASAPRVDGPGYETLGVVRTNTDPDNIRAEFAVVIRDDLQGEGLGAMLMEKMIRYCRDRGTLQILGTTLPTNLNMQRLAKKLGFDNGYNAEEEVVEMTMMLNEPKEDWQLQRLQH
ncbi:bifunctional acetate--CoA ligase family protein/GNAT family N-acetyltransferase [Motiliproteus sp. MSK22-1]|uniref:bifunctional acetate--CoA ligase family protein/GNAT family N-acetyltransferase n=1 Tax=Motiliproteus sp. MSK22-1 TaxID=1897630 RepID=UPI001E354E21|nr:bifunctional acetate--CoA ligase family protein/GNAT family N-acetyltransferase [Motiliproteus sp. MSK22-1]